MSGNRQVIDELRDLLWSIEEGSISDEGIGSTSWSAKMKRCCGNMSNTRGWFPT